MAEGDVREDDAITVGVLGVLILLCGIGNFCAGIVWVAEFHITGGTGIWSGIPVSDIFLNAFEVFFFERIVSQLKKFTK